MSRGGTHFPQPPERRLSAKDGARLLLKNGHAFFPPTNRLPARTTHLPPAMSERILFVDDDPLLLKMQRQSFGEAYGVEIAESVRAALATIEKRGPFAAIISDMNMPQMSGVELFEELRTKAPDTVRIMMTGEGKDAAIQAVNRGQIFRFLTKPFRQSEMRAAVEAAVLQYQLVRAERDLLDKTLRASVKVLTEILAMAAPAIFGRAEKLRRLVRQFHRATQLGVPWQLDVAAMLAPIGLVTLPASLHAGSPKAGPRSAAEEALFRTVPQIGHKLVADIPRLEAVAKIILYQHQRFDGGGSLPGSEDKGETIPICARILKVLGDFVALEGDGTSAQAAFAEMEKLQPGCYDPKILAAAQEVLAPRTVTVGERPSIFVKLKDLEPGQILAGPICTKQGMLLVAAGAEITGVLLKRLLNFAELSGLREPVEVECGMAGETLPTTGLADFLS